ncbi:MAG: hypothetical protein GXO54_07135 [Chloroflexi bacterium]|nr:hypothetical protein [Chloroflexota bacterium]
MALGYRCPSCGAAYTSAEAAAAGFLCPRCGVPLVAVEAVERPETPAVGVVIPAAQGTYTLRRALNASRDLWLAADAEGNLWVVRWRQAPRAEVDEETLLRVLAAVPNHLPVRERVHWTERVVLWICPYVAAGALQPMPLPHIDWARLRRVVEDVSAALEVLHAQGWVHTAVRPSNLFPYPPEVGGFRVAIGDFRHARPRGIAHHHPNPAWAPPEWAPALAASAGPVPLMIQPAVDWWGLGLTILALLDANPLARAARPLDLLLHWDADRYLQDLALPEPWRVLLRGLLSPSPAHRWGIGQVKAWLSGDHLIPVVEPSQLTRWRFAGAEYLSIDDLVDAALLHWDEARRWFFEEGHGYTLLTFVPLEVRRQAAAVLSRAEGDLDQRLAQLLWLLSPRAALGYRGTVYATRAALAAALSGSELPEPLRALRDAGLLSFYFRLRGSANPYGVEVDEGWLEQLAAWETARGPVEMLRDLLFGPERTLLAAPRRLLAALEREQYVALDASLEEPLKQLRTCVAEPKRCSWARLLEAYLALRVAIQEGRLLDYDNVATWLERVRSQWHRWVTTRHPLTPEATQHMMTLRALLAQLDREGMTDDVAQRIAATHTPELIALMQQATVDKAQWDAWQRLLRDADMILESEAPWSDEAMRAYEELNVAVSVFREALEAQGDGIPSLETLAQLAEALSARLFAWRALPVDERAPREELAQHWRRKQALAQQGLAAYWWTRSVPWIARAQRRLERITETELPPPRAPRDQWRRLRKIHDRAAEVVAKVLPRWWPREAARAFARFIALSWPALATWALAWAMFFELPKPIAWSAWPVMAWLGLLLFYPPWGVTTRALYLRLGAWLLLTLLTPVAWAFAAAWLADTGSFWWTWGVMGLLFSVVGLSGIFEEAGRPGPRTWRLVLVQILLMLSCSPVAVPLGLLALLFFLFDGGVGRLAGLYLLAALMASWWPWSRWLAAAVLAGAWLRALLRVSLDDIALLYESDIDEPPAPYRLTSPRRRSS